MNLSDVKNIQIPEGSVVKIHQTQTGVVLWEKKPSTVRLTLNLIGDTNGYYELYGDGEYDVGTTVKIGYKMTSNYVSTSTSINDIYIVDHWTDTNEYYYNKEITLTKDTTIDCVVVPITQLAYIDVNLSYTSQSATNYYSYEVSNADCAATYIPYRKTSATGTAFSKYSVGSLGTFLASSSTDNVRCYYREGTVLTNKLFSGTKTANSLKVYGFESAEAVSVSSNLYYRTITINNSTNLHSSSNCVLDANGKLIFGCPFSNKTSSIGCTSIGDYAFANRYYTTSGYTFTIDTDIESIGKYAFYNTLVAKLYDYGNKITNVDDEAFKSCGSSTSSSKSTLYINTGTVPRSVFNTQLINSTDRYWMYCAEL